MRSKKWADIANKILEDALHKFTGEFDDFHAELVCSCRMVYMCFA